MKRLLLFPVEIIIEFEIKSTLCFLKLENMISKFICLFYFFISITILNAQQFHAESYKIESYLKNKGAITYHAEMDHNLTFFKDCKNSISYNIEIRFLEENNNVSTYLIRFLNIDSCNCLMGLDRFVYEISTDSHGNLIKLNNWNKMHGEFIKNTRFQNKEDFIDTLRVLVDHLFYLYGKVVSHKENLKYLSFIHLNLNKSYLLDSEATIKTTAINSEILNIQVEDYLAFEMDAVELNLDNIKATRNFIFDKIQNLLLSAKTTTTFFMNKKKYSIVRSLTVVN
jgi:hypothetical protein